MIEAGVGTATILYTDVVGSTQMRARLGDVEADLVRRRHDEVLRASVAKHSGTVVKGLGDGILAAFGATAEAVNAAHEIQREIDRANRQSREDRRIEVRVGISAGDVSWEDGDCHGTPVVTAARLCDAHPFRSEARSPPRTRDARFSRCQIRRRAGTVGGLRG